MAIAIADVQRRIGVLDYLHRSSSAAAAELSARLATTDPSPEVRRSAFFNLFKEGRSGFFRLFLRDAKSLGWNFQMLRVLRASSHGNSRRIGKIAKVLLQKKTNPEERIRIIGQWSELHGSEWDKAAKEEYLRLTEERDTSSSDFAAAIQSRCVLLEMLSKIDPKWCSRRFAEEISSAQDMQ